jgi:hypothetical protein
MRTSFLVYLRYEEFASRLVAKAQALTAASLRTRGAGGTSGGAGWTAEAVGRALWAQATLAAHGQLLLPATSEAGKPAASSGFRGPPLPPPQPTAGMKRNAVRAEGTAAADEEAALPSPSRRLKARKRQFIG